MHSEQQRAEARRIAARQLGRMQTHRTPEALRELGPAKPWTAADSARLKAGIDRWAKPKVHATEQEARRVGEAADTHGRGIEVMSHDGGWIVRILGDDAPGWPKENA